MVAIETNMGISQYEPAALGRPAWNARKQVGVKKPLKQRQIWAVRFFLDGCILWPAACNTPLDAHSLFYL